VLTTRGARKSCLKQAVFSGWDRRGDFPLIQAAGALRGLSPALGAAPGPDCDGCELAGLPAAAVSSSRRTVLTEEQTVMKAIKTYSTRLDADLAKIELDAANVPSVVVGTGVDVEGGAAGVQLLVPDECVEAALMVLEGR
jgi:hypothetical protein